jgi:pSer/pThr/pTyr-binding forkhead associated (FHA) protein
MVKIGRRLDNHLILEDRHVSRSHARLDVVEGHYVIVDLGSTAGTRVNGRLITRHTLRPGDIVSIAAVQMIYGEDPGGPPEDTSRYRPSPTADDEQDQVTPLNLFRSIEKPTAPYIED